MRIHSDTLTVQDIREAQRLSHTGLTYTEHGSRKRSHAFEVKLTGSSPRRPNGGRYGSSQSEDFAATWDEWGIFIGHLFEVDAKATMTFYEDAYEFHRKTDDRFVDLAWEDQCRTHNWEYVYPREHTCKKCGARQVR